MDAFFIGILVLAADQVSSTFWLLHSDLHEDRVTSIFDYMSSIVASVEPLNQYANFQMHNLKDLSLLDENSSKGRFHVRFKRRNGRVRVMVFLPSLYMHFSVSG